MSKLLPHIKGVADSVHFRDVRSSQAEKKSPEGQADGHAISPFTWPETVWLVHEPNRWPAAPR